MPVLLQESVSSASEMQLVRTHVREVRSVKELGSVPTRFMAGRVSLMALLQAKFQRHGGEQEGT